MSTTTANSSNGTNAGGMLHVDESSMRTNKVEQVSSLLISVAVMLALAVAMLFLLFLLSMNWKRQGCWRSDVAPGRMSLIRIRRSLAKNNAAF